jgi:hypothetical protein
MRSAPHEGIRIVVEANLLLQDTVSLHLPGAPQTPTVSLAVVGALEKGKRERALWLPPTTKSGHFCVNLKGLIEDAHGTY